MQITNHQAKYYAHELTIRHAAGGVDSLSQSLFDASVDLNPHQYSVPTNPDTHLRYALSKK